MQALAEWVRLIIIVATITTVAKAVLPEGNMRHYVELVLGLVMLATLLQPLLYMLQSSYGASPLSAPALNAFETEELIRRGQHLGDAGVDIVLQAETTQMKATIKSLVLLVDEVDGVAVGGIYMNDHGIDAIELSLTGRPNAGDGLVKRLLAAFLGIEENAVRTTWIGTGNGEAD